MRLFLALGIILTPTFLWATTDGSDLAFYIGTFSTTTYAQLLLTDSAGRQTGQQGFQGPEIDNIPNSNYIVDATEDIDTGTSGVQRAEAGIGPVTAGQYSLTVLGMATTPFQLTVRAAHTDGSSSLTTFQGFIVQNSTREYVTNFDPASGGQLTVIKTVSFSTLREDLQTAFQLGQIGGRKFVDALDDLLAQGQKALKHQDDRDHHHDGDDDHSKREAVEKLREFIAQVDRAAKPKDDHDRKDDRDRDEKRFATSTAAQSLTTDAKTLLQQLEGSPEKDHDHHDRDNEGH